MNRAPLPRRTPLRRGGTPLVRRTPLRPISDRRRSDLPRRAEVKAEVLDRDGGCLLAGYGVGRCWGPNDLHELKKASQASDTYTVENGVILCRGHNGWVEDAPDVAWALGLVIRTGDPAGLATDRRRRHGLVPRSAR